MKCPNCGKLLLLGAPVCRWCKSKLSIAPQTARPNRSGSQMDQVMALLQHALSLVLAQGHREGIPGVEHEVREASIVVGGRTLTVTAVPENLAEQPGKYLCAARFEVSCEGTPLPAFTMGVVGNDVDKAGALQGIVSYLGPPTHAEVAMKTLAMVFAGTGFLRAHTHLRREPETGSKALGMFGR